MSRAIRDQSSIFMLDESSRSSHYNSQLNFMTSLSLDGGYLVDGVGYPLHAGYGGQHQHALLAPAHGRGLLLGDLAVPVQVHVVEGGEGAEVAGQLVPGGGDDFYHQP